MSTDLNAVKDHPATILSALADTLIEGGWVRATVADTANVLREYEQEHAVTFAALDNDALAAVRDAHALVERSDLGSVQRVRALSALYLAVGGLLGLGD